MSSKHKELTPMGIKIHVEHVKNLKQRHLLTGEIIETATVSDIIQALEVRVSQYKAYKIKHSSFFKYDAKKYTNIRKICHYLGKDVCESIFASHAAAGSGTTSYFSRASKL